MSTLLVALALAALAAATAAAPYALHAAAPYLVAGLWAYAMWLAHRAALREYHRHGRPGLIHHRRTTRTARALLAARRARALRLTTTGRTAS